MAGICYLCKLADYIYANENIKSISIRYDSYAIYFLHI